MACSKVISDFEILSSNDLGRRRDWSDAEQVRIVEKSFRGHWQGSATARRCCISRSPLTWWRKEYRLGLLGGTSAGFTQLQVAPHSSSAASAQTHEEAIEEKVGITLTNGRQPSIALWIDGTALTRLLQVLERALSRF